MPGGLLSRSVLRDAAATIGNGEFGLFVIDGAAGTGRTTAIDQLAAIAQERDASVAVLRVPPEAASDDEVDAALTAHPDWVFVDDAHRLRPQSLQRLVTESVRRRGAFGLVVSASYDATTAAVLDEIRAVPEARLVQLDRFDDDEIDALVARRLSSADEATRAVLKRRSAGNPFLLVALLDEIAADPGSAAIDDIVPVRIRAQVGTRLARLGPDALGFARAVQTLGDAATLDRVAQLANLDRRRAEDVADLLVSHEMLDASPVFHFREPLVADAVDHALEPYARERLHREAASLLVTEHAPAKQIASHLMQSSPTGLAWVAEQLIRAGREASQAGDVATAAVLFARAAAEPPAPDAVPGLLAELAFAESRAGTPSATTSLDAALRVAPSTDVRIMLLRERARLLWLMGRLPEAVEASEAALAESESGTELHETLLAELLAVASMHDVSPIFSRPRLVELLERANNGWVPDAPALAATLATVLPYVLGDQRRVPALVDRALEEDPWRVDSEPFGMRPDFVIGALWLTDSLARGERIALQGIATVDPENQFRHGLLQFWLGELRYAAGDLVGAIAAATSALEPQWGPFISWLGYSSATLAHAHMDRNELRQARVALDETHDQLDPDQLTGIAVAFARARLLYRTGQAADARDLIARVTERLDRLGHRDGPQVVWRPLAAAAAMATGDNDAAKTLLDEEVALAGRTHSGARLGRALGLAAEIATPGHRLKLLHEAASVLRASERRLDYGRAVLALGFALLADDDVPAAREAFAEARELAEACGAPNLAATALNALHTTGARPRRTARTGMHSLTGAEQRIVLLAASGKTNREIGESLSIAPRTVEWHLGRAFRKLGVVSRRELPDVINPS